MSLSKFVNGMVIGAIAGAATGWFMHSKKGQELIDDAHYAALNIKDKVSDKASALKDAAKQKSDTLKSKLSTVAKEAKDSVSQKTDEMKNAANDTQNNPENSSS